MAKLKTNKSAKKRFRKRAHSFKRKKGCYGHLLTKKAHKRKRQARKIVSVSKADEKRIKKLIPY